MNAPRGQCPEVEELTGNTELLADTEQARINHVLVMNHQGEQAAVAIAQVPRVLQEAGYSVTVANGPAESARMLSTLRPSAVVLSPIVLEPGGVELEMVESIQREDDPIPVILVVDSPMALRELARFKNQLFHDFVLGQNVAEELVHRVGMAMHKREKYVAMTRRARDLEGQMIRDFKTGLYTERHFRHLMRLEFQRSERHKAPLSFLLLDLDDFKKINDRADYAFGDEVLQMFAETLRGNLREIDHAARFGGDEFMVLLPQTTPAEAVEVAARIKSLVAKREVANGRYSARPTVSVGIASYDGRGPSSPEELRRHANSALKQAKRRGKNGIWLYSPESVLHEPNNAEPQGGTPATPTVTPTANPAAPPARESESTEG
jgi:diguanylate cyclase (GGDEF)-like protein